LVNPTGADERELSNCATVATGVADHRNIRKVESRSARSASVAGTPPGSPNTADMITSRVICWAMSATGTNSPVGHASMWVAVAVSMPSRYAATALP